MTDIVERLRFDAARCEVDYSKGVAGNITEAADEIERLNKALDEIIFAGDVDLREIAMRARRWRKVSAVEQSTRGGE